MNFRTDIAMERRDFFKGENLEGAKTESEKRDELTISRLEITDDYSSKKLCRDKGKYITLEFSFDIDLSSGEKYAEIFAEELLKLISDGTVLVAGLGNTEITPDSLGPETASKIIATRHIRKDFAKAFCLDKLRSVCTVSPGVSGQTGIDAMEIIRGVVNDVKPSAVIAVDALASKQLNRLGRIIQITDTGIYPGSGIGNRRMKLDEKSLGVKVISIGIPTVADVFCVNENYEKEKMIVTSKEIDLMTENCSKFLAFGINKALQPDLTSKDILSFIS